MAKSEGKSKEFSWSSLFKDVAKRAEIVELGPASGAPAARELLDLNSDAYLRLRLISFYHPLIRRGWTKQQPVIYAQTNWSQPSAGELPQIKIITPTVINHPDAKKGGAYAFQGQVIFGPVKFNGSLDFSIGLQVKKSNENVRNVIDGAAKAIEAISPNRLAIIDIDPSAKLLSEAAKLLLPDSTSKVLVGTTCDIPGASENIETGCWALLSLSRSS